MAAEEIHATRICTKCGVAKSESAEFFPRWVGGANGLARQCRQCRSEYMKRRYELDPEPAKARAQAKRDRKPKRQGPPLPPGTKVCRSCWGLYPATAEFFMLDTHYNPPRPCSPCRGCGNAASYQRKKAAPHKVKAQAERYRERGKQKSKEWRRANPERYKAICKANFHRRRTASSGKPNFTASDVQKQKAAQRNRCWWCQVRLTNFEVDHRIPVSKGGTNAADNIVISCKPCNRSKSARMPWELENPRLL